MGPEDRGHQGPTWSEEKAELFSRDLKSREAGASGCLKVAPLHCGLFLRQNLKMSSVPLGSKSENTHVIAVEERGREGPFQM